LRVTPFGKQLCESAGVARTEGGEFDMSPCRRVFQRQPAIRPRAEPEGRIRSKTLMFALGRQAPHHRADKSVRSGEHCFNRLIVFGVEDIQAAIGAIYETEIAFRDWLRDRRINVGSGQTSGCGASQSKSDHKACGQERATRETVGVRHDIGSPGSGGGC
jgi:hypothetical protein